MSGSVTASQDTGNNQQIPAAPGTMQKAGNAAVLEASRSDISGNTLTTGENNQGQVDTTIDGSITPASDTNPLASAVNTTRDELPSNLPADMEVEEVIPPAQDDAVDAVVKADQQGTEPVTHRMIQM